MEHGDSDCLQSRLEKIVDERLSQLDSEKRHQANGDKEAKRDKNLDKKLKGFCTAVGGTLSNDGYPDTSYDVPFVRVDSLDDCLVGSGS
jgi:hypothetical protein